MSSNLHATRSDVLRTTESDSDDEEEYEIKRNKFGALIYGLKPAPYLNCNDPVDRSLALQTGALHPTYMSQPQYDQCYQQYSPPPPQYQQQQDDDE
ncbi:hypothetical protein Tco_1514445 [Tanacetum coccineum]